MDQKVGVFSAGGSGEIDIVANGKGLGFQLLAQVFGIAADMNLNFGELAAKMRLQPLAQIAGQFFPLGAFGRGGQSFALGLSALGGLDLGSDFFGGDRHWGTLSNG